MRALVPSRALWLDRVRFGYPGMPAPVLDAVSLDLRASAGVALLGPNGAGKTTLMRLGAALLHPQSGRVETAGRDTRGCNPEALADVVGYLFQSPESQLFNRTVRTEIAFGPRQLGWSESRIATGVDAVLDELELAPLAETHPYDLPAPIRRLVALAGTVVADPALLLLDEPTAGLDRASRALVQRVVAARRARGCAVLAVTHDLTFAVEALDRAIVLHQGRVGYDGPLGEALGRDDLCPLPLPPPAALARALALSPRSGRLGDVAAALAARCRGSG